ncbi:hypothetical protein BGX34_004162, partial [Mortierella sp. NVP85]
MISSASKIRNGMVLPTSKTERCSVNKSDLLMAHDYVLALAKKSFKYNDLLG